MRVTLEHVGSGATKEGEVLGCETTGRHPVARIRVGFAGIFFFRLTNGYGHERQCRYWRVQDADALREYAARECNLTVRPGPPPVLNMAPKPGEKPARRASKLRQMHPRQEALFGE